MKVFVTGGTGFLGSHVIEQLVADGHQVRALVRKTSKKDLLEKLGVELIEASLTSGEGLEECVRDVDAVVHCAGVVKARTPEEFHQVNTGGTKRLLEAVRKARPELKRFVLVSSLEAHGPSSDGEPRPTDAVATPVTHYGRSKLAAEEAVLAFKDDIPVTILRPTAIYGPRDQEMYAFFQTVKRHLVPLLGGGENTVTVVYGPDCADAIYKALTVDHPSGSIYFVADGKRYTWGEMGKILQGVLKVRALHLPMPVFIFSILAFFSEMYGKLAGKAVMLTRDKVNALRAKHWVCSPEEITRDLGWTPRHDFAAGAQLTVDWYRQNGWL